MTREEIYNSVISTKWENHPNIKNVETSEIVTFWNDKIAFSVHALRKKNEYPFTFVVTLFKPERKYGITLDDIDFSLITNNINTSVVSELLSNKELHKQFLDNLDDTKDSAK
jgi:hypothetical protein